MRGTKFYGIVAAAFMAGAFLASPELRAYASTIANDVICNGCVGTSDLAGSAVTNAKLANGAVNSAKIADNSISAADIGANAVGSSEIATDAVGGSELQGVTKLLFGQCVLTSGENGVLLQPGIGLTIGCNISGVDSDDSASATMTSGNVCFAVTKADADSSGVLVGIRNVCNSNQTPGPGGALAVIVYDK
ncbi:MAG: hypothetical protein ACRD5H_09485 [Nitrososphaerales archaeon]